MQTGQAGNELGESQVSPPQGPLSGEPILATDGLSH